VSGHKREPGIGKRVIKADWLKPSKVLVHRKYTTKSLRKKADVPPTEMSERIKGGRGRSCVEERVEEKKKRTGRPTCQNLDMMEER
jgi:hypothetical protein